MLGAIVSPPDAVAATGIIKGLGLNKKVITILEGESLLNDASALIAYRYAVAAVTTGSFVLWKAGLQFLLVAGAGILVGIVIGYLFVLAHKKIQNNSVVETSLTLLSPYVSYLAAEEFHVSGILAVVSAGLIISWRAPEVFSFQTRMRTRVVWDTLVFLLHGFVFILIGLQVPFIIRGLGNYPFFEILGYGLLISLVTIIVRIVWVFAGAYSNNIFKKKDSAGDTTPGDEEQTWKNVLIVAWTGTRGVISLATALAIPFTLQDGTAFPKRNSIIFLAFIVIFVTLVVQGLTLPLLIRLLRIKPQAQTDKEEKELQLYMANNTLQFLDHEFTGQIDHRLREQLKKKYEQLINNLTQEIKIHKIAKRQNEVPVSTADPMVNAQLEIKKFQRELLIKLHKEGEFSDDAIRQVERLMDVDELKLNLQLPKEEQEGTRI